MSLGNPLGLLALGLAGPLVLWYLLRSRRPRVTVASTFLWQQAQQPVSAALPWQRFRPDLTFWLVLVALVAGALALAQPFLRVPAVLGDHTILVVDASGSMLADEEGPTRLELARREAEALVDTMAPGQEVSVVEAGARARVLLSASPDPSAVRDALRAVRLGHGPADLRDAFTLSAALQRPGQDTVVHLLTDGEVPVEYRDDLPAGLQVTAVGEPRPNLGITRLQAVPTGAGSSQVFVQVRNHGQQETDAVLSLAVNEAEVVSERFRVPPRADEDRVLNVTGGDGEVLAASVRPAGQDVTGADRADALAVDDRAFSLLSSPREIAVTLATDGNVFLSSALGAIPEVTLEVVDEVPDQLADTDLLVVDGLAAPSSLSVPTLLVGPTTWPDGITTSDEVERPSLTHQDPQHELLADVDLSQVSVASATPLTAPALTPLAGGPQGELFLAGRLDGVPTVAVGFDLSESNLPLAAGWPILVANTTSWLAGPPATVPAEAGATVTVPTVEGATELAVSSPSGQTHTLDPASPRLTVDEVGLWRIDYRAEEGTELPEGPPAIAVNPVASEGDLARPAPAPLAADQPAGGDEEAAAGPAEGRAPLGRLVLVAVLALAVAEWLWVHAVRPWWRRRRGPRRRVSDISTEATAPADPDRRPVP